MFTLRYLEGGKRKWEEVGPDPQLALTAKLRREHLLQGLEIGQPVAYDLGVIQRGGDAEKDATSSGRKGLPEPAGAEVETYDRHGIQHCSHVLRSRGRCGAR